MTNLARSGVSARPMVRAPCPRRGGSHPCAISGVPNCGQQLAFENSLCLRCGSSLAFDLDEVQFEILGLRQASAVDGPGQACANRDLAACNWLTDAQHPLCRSCALTRTRPADADLAALPLFAEAEAAKRRLVVELTELGLPIDGRDADPATGLCFDLLSSESEQVMTGHADGVITLDLSEGDDVHREQLRVSMDEPYRTLLGHFRHEIGHYYFTVLVGEGHGPGGVRGAVRRPGRRLPGGAGPALLAGRAGRLGGPLRVLLRHHAPGRGLGRDASRTTCTSATPSTPQRLSPSRPRTPRWTGRWPGERGFDRIIELWLPLSWSLNMINRSMGRPDLYPFVLPPAVLDKMRSGASAGHAGLRVTR